MFVSEMPKYTNMSSVEEKPNLINAKPAIFEETLQKEQQKKRRPSQIQRQMPNIFYEGSANFCLPAKSCLLHLFLHGLSAENTGGGYQR